MIYVKGFPILVDEVEILQTIREQVLVQQNREILRKIKKSGNNIMVCCPFHNNGQERKPSCGILLVDKKENKAGDFNCFACHETGTFSKFVSGCFGYDDNGEFGEKWLLDNYVSGEDFERPNILQQEKRPDFLKVMNKLLQKPKYISEEELAQYRFYHPYMWKRHLTPEVVEKYDVGYQKDYLVFHDEKTGYKKYDEVLTFPCRDINGNCLFVSRRSIKGKSFYLPQNIDKPIYGVYELPDNAKDVVICESVFNALTCATWGIPALAMFGTGNSMQYEQLLRLPIRHYVLGLDPDKAGESGTWKLKKALGKYKNLTKLIIPKGKDINDLTYKEFINLKEIAV